MKVVIPFVQIEAYNPNISRYKKSASKETYFECMLVAFYSLRFWNPTLALQLTTNVAPNEIYRIQLEKLKVSIKYVNYSHNPPQSFGNRFRACFYIFDAMSAEVDEDVLYLDPDIYCAGPLNINKIFTTTISALHMNFPNSREINGITPEEAGNIYSGMHVGPSAKKHQHLGGEALFVPKKLSLEIIRRIDEIWHLNTMLSEDGKPYLTTEEHLLSVILGDYEVTNLSELILRIWTSPKYRVVEGGIFDANQLPIWHLPAEKSFGFHTAYNLMRKNRFFQSPENDIVRRRAAIIFHLNDTKYLNIIKRLFSISLFKFESFADNFRRN